MITIAEWMELIEHRITDGSNYGWHCYGGDAYQLDSWNGDHEGHSVCIVFDRKDQTVYSVEAHDFANRRSYRLMNPDHVEAYRAEQTSRGVTDEAYDDVPFIDLETDDDFIEKAYAIINSLPYDLNIEVPIDLPEKMMFELMKMAHDQDITLNKLVNNILREMIIEDKGSLNGISS